MQLRCPHCTAEVITEGNDLTSGMARCGVCKMEFQIAPQLERATFVFRTKEASYYKTKIHRRENETVFAIFRKPESGVLMTVLFPLFVFGIVFYSIILASEPHTFLEFAIVGFPFLFLVFLYLWAMLGKVFLVITPDTMAMHYRFLMFTRRKLRPRSSFVKIAEHVEFDSYSNPTYFIRMQFSPGTAFNFGRRLTHNERVWLIGEIEAVIKGEQTS